MPWLLERGADERRHAAAGERRRGAARRWISVGGELAAGDPRRHQLVVELGDRLDHLLARAARAPARARAGSAPSVNVAPKLVVVPRARAHRDEIDHAAKLVAEAERQLDRDRRRAEPRAHLGDHARRDRRRRDRTC